MIRSAIVVAGLLFAAAPACAQTFGDVAVLTIRPNSSADLNLPRANATVRVSCTPRLGPGGLACTVLEESPQGSGFGAAAILVASRLNAPPRVDAPLNPLTMSMTFCFDPSTRCTDTPSIGETAERLEDAVLANIVEGPRLGDLSYFYPRAAWRAGIEGSVNVQCRVRRRARYDDCIVISEEPRGWGFGAATVALMADSRAPLVTNDGRSLVGHLIIVPVSFRRR